jgi:hypothetical protein
MARMQRDLFVLGMVAAEAVELGRESACALGDIPINTLQDRLVELGALQPVDLAEDNLGFLDVPVIVDALLQSKGLAEALEPSAQLLVIGKDRVLPILNSMGHAMSPALARLLCFWKEERGLDSVRSSVLEAVGAAELPSEFFSNGIKAHLLPDHGFAPMPVLQLNNLALAGDSSVADLLASVADRFETISGAYETLWAYAFGLAYAAERIASGELVDLVAKVLASPALDCKPVSADDDIRACADIELERRIYLRLCLTRALARCGSRQGVAGLIEYLDEARAAFAVSARDELEEITGEKYGYDRTCWHNWLTQNSSALSPAPVATDYE